MTNYLMSNDSFITPSVYKPRLSHWVYIYTHNNEEGKELADQIGFFGYQLQVFKDKEELRAATRRFSPIAIIMLVLDKDISEFETTADFFKKQTHNIPILVISTVEDFSMRLRVVRAGCMAFFTYPVDISPLVGTLDDISNPNTNSPFRILVIEDAISQASYYAMHLEKIGMETRIITDPTRFLQPLLEFNPDLILLDLYFPACTGSELAQVIRQMENYVTVPIVFLSSETDKERQLAAMFMGGDDFLIKPIKPEHLIAAITSRIERYRKLRNLMVYDGLTSLLNHTTIKEWLVKEILRAERDKLPLAYAMIDLDHFKDVNDRHGHANGDRVLKSLARLLKQRLRRSDLIGRYGGEEFAVILPNTTTVEAVSVMDKLREGFSKLRHQGSEGPFSVTFSCGVAAYPEHKGPAALNQAADKALYQAKHQGRNRVITL